MSEVSPSNAFSAEPVTIGVSSPGNSYVDSRSRTSISTSSSKLFVVNLVSLVHVYHDVRHATWRASRMCSRVCGIGPSAALTTRIAPSICAAPVIMFFT